MCATIRHALGVAIAKGGTPTGVRVACLRMHQLGSCLRVAGVLPFCTTMGSRTRLDSRSISTASRAPFSSSMVVVLKSPCSANAYFKETRPPRSRGRVR